MKYCKHCKHRWSTKANECPKCHHVWSNSQYTIHLPTKSDIREATKAIRATWSPAERQKRIANDFYKTVPAEILVHVQNPTCRRTYSDPSKFPNH